MSAADGFEGAVALVTGGARGVGAACAAELAARGADVALLDLPGGADLRTPSYPLAGDADLEASAAAVRGHGRRCLTLRADVRDHDAVREAVARVDAELGPIRLLVHAAGIRTVAPVAVLDDAQWAETVDVNLNGTYHVLREVVPTMIAGGGGRVVVLCGDEGRRGAPRLSHQAAAAWGTIGLAKSVAVETADAGIAVNVVTTTPLDTTSFNVPESWAQAVGAESADAEEAAHALRVRHPLSRAFVPAEEAVDAVLYLLGRPGEEMTGSVLDVSMGLSALNSV
ncbi:MAG TPA: SDR family NAD(P)-dependent oxidoreductase [Solirubrobacterales bacterium]